MAYEKGIPFYVAVDVTKFDPVSLLGIPFPVREMPASDIWQGEIPALVTVRNPVFEIVPAKLIRGFITEAWSRSLSGDVSVRLPAAGITNT
jgi:translation initiation factor 2B subunit (eIF-2B alpha/beta/delta family)